MTGTGFTAASSGNSVGGSATVSGGNASLANGIRQSNLLAFNGQIYSGITFTSHNQLTLNYVSPPASRSRTATAAGRTGGWTC